MTPTQPFTKYCSTKAMIAAAFAACVFNVSALSYIDGPQVGDLAPALKITNWLQAPPEAAKGWPTGKVVVLEFWSTTCAPCVEVIPHMNELAEKFKNRPVQFVAVTDEDEAVVQRFLNKTPIRAWIGLFPGGVFGETSAYRVEGIPHTVIIDARGKIAAVMDPRDVTPALITQCLDGKALWTKQLPMPRVVAGQYQSGIAPLFQALIVPSPETRFPMVGDYTAGRLPYALTDRHDQLRNAIAFAFGTPWTRVIAEVELPKENYDFYVTLPKSVTNQDESKNLKAVFSQAIEVTFGLSVKQETREMNVLVLRTNALSARKLARSNNPTGEHISGPGRVCASNVRLSQLARGLEYGIAIPVLDETGLTDVYSFDVEWNQKTHKDTNPEGMIAAVNNLGLDLVPAKKLMEVVVVRQAP
jgi:uncharacterized protein (TIGR03435 family)